jgi:hypothetical protein
MMRFPFLVLLLALAGCATMQEPDTSVSYDEGRSQRARVPLDSVVVFGPEMEIPDVYRRFGRIRSQGLVSDTVEVSVLRALRERASEVGAEGVQIMSAEHVDLSRGAVETNPATGMPSFNQGVRYRIEATAFHRTDRGYQPPEIGRPDN